MVRLKGEVLKISNDRAEILKQYFDAKSELQKVFQTSAVIESDFTEKEIAGYIRPYTLDDLKAEALASRPDLLIMKQNEVLAQQYLNLQKQRKQDTMS